MEETRNAARYEYSDQSSNQDDSLTIEGDISTVRPLQALERIMQRHPSLWDRSSIDGLFLVCKPSFFTNQFSLWKSSCRTAD